MKFKSLRLPVAALVRAVLKRRARTNKRARQEARKASESSTTS